MKAHYYTNLRFAFKKRLNYNKGVGSAFTIFNLIIDLL